jgi:4-carboxymuconolactone decarboxylase
MSYMKGVEPAQAGWLTRLIYWFVRRGIRKATGTARLIEPVKVAAHHPRLLRAMGKTDGAVEAAQTLPVTLKRLVTLKAAMLIGCPF